MKTHIYLILDTFWLDDLRHERIIGVFSSPEIAINAICEADLKNFRWCGASRFKYSDDITAHECFILKRKLDSLYEVCD